MGGREAWSRSTAICLRLKSNGTDAAAQRPNGPIPPRAGVGLKPQHYREILETRPDIGWFEIHAENYMGEGGPPHRYLERHPRALSDLAPWRRPLDRRRGPARQGASRAAEGARRALRARAVLRASRLVEPRQRLSQRSPAAALHRRDAGAGLPITSTRCRRRSGAGCCSRIPRPMWPSRQCTMSEIEFLARDRAAHRLRPAARRQQCLRPGDQSRLRRRTPIIDAFPVEHVGEIHLGGHAAGQRRRRRSALLIDDHGQAIADSGAGRSTRARSRAAARCRR